MPQIPTQSHVYLPAKYKCHAKACLSKKKSMLYVLVTEILKWLKVTVMQMEWKNWSSQQNMAKQEINVQKHTFLYRGLNFWLQQLVVINTKNLDTSVK